MSDWQTKKIEELAAKDITNSFIDGDWIESEHITNEGIRIIQTGNIGISKYINKPDNKKFISEISFKVLKCKKVFPGDLLICRLADPIGRCCIVPNEEPFYVTAVDVIILRPSNEISRKFLLYYLNDEKILKTANDQAAGSTRQRISRTNYGGISIKIPSFNEQTRIAEILSTADEAITRTEALIAKYQRIKTGLMQDLLTRGIDEHGNIRSEDTHKFVVKNGIKVPEEWEVEMIEKHCIESAFGPRFPGTLYSKSGNIGTLRTTDLDHEGNINYTTIPLANLNPQEFRRHFLQNKDLLITRSGTVGIVSVFRSQVYNIIPGAFLIRFRLSNALVPEYLRYYFTNEAGKRRLIDLAEGGVQKNIRGSSVLKLFVPIPSETEQSQIIQRLEQFENAINSLSNSLIKLQCLKTGLMQDLLSGKVRAQVQEEVKEEMI